MPRIKKEEPNEEEQDTADSAILSPKESLEAQLAELDALRANMLRLGIDSISKLDAVASQIKAEIQKA